MSRKRVTEECALDLVKNLIQTGDLAKFVDQVSDQASWFGRFGKDNRYLFTEELKRLIHDRGIGISI